MRVRILIVIRLALVSIFLVVSHYAQAMTFDSLKRLIQQNQIQSVQALLPLLPPALRSKYVLMFKSRSLQEGSYSDPRVLLYGDDAKFIVSFNGSSVQTGFDALETMEFDDRSKEFRYREILFSRGGNDQRKVSFSESNSKKCTACHGADSVRPIWDTYPIWPGAYGERARSPLSIAERNGVRLFLERQATHPRYRYLINTGIFAQAETFYSGAKNKYDGTRHESPNEELSRLLSALNNQRIAAIVKDDGHFEAFRYALLASLNRDCGAIENFIPESSRPIFSEKLKSFLAETEIKNKNQERVKRVRTVSLEYGTSPTEVSEPMPLNSFRFLVENGLGISTAQWSTALETQTYDFNALHSPEDEIVGDLLQAVSFTDPKIVKLASLGQVGESDKYCSALRNQSRSALGTLALNWSPRSVNKVILTTSENFNQDSRSFKGPMLLSKCVECHQGEVAPALPFDRPEVLAKLLGLGNYPRGTLLSEILFRISPDAGADQMPRGMNISEGERSGLKDYFRAVAGVTKNAD